MYSNKMISYLKRAIVRVRVVCMDCYVVASFIQFILLDIVSYIQSTKTASLKLYGAMISFTGQK